MDSYLDLIPSSERQKIRERLKLSEGEYEKLRERVKGPEDLKMELERGEVLAEARLKMELEPGVKDALQKQIEMDMKERGIEEIVEGVEISAEAKAAIESGNFDVSIESHPESHQDQLAILPEGRVGEVVPIRLSLGDQYLSGLAS